MHLIVAQGEIDRVAVGGAGSIMNVGGGLEVVTTTRPNHFSLLQ